MDAFRLNDNTLVFKYQEMNDQPNLVYFHGENRAVLVDAGPSPRFAKEVLQYLKEQGLHEPDYIVLTHYHWDHTFGMSGYDGLTVASSFTNDRLRELASTDFKSGNYISDLLINEFSVEHLNFEYPNPADITVAECDKVVDDVKSIDMGGICLSIMPIPSSHTAGSLAVKCGDVLAVGDADCEEIIGIEFIENYAMMERFLKVMEAVEFKTVISGHYPPKEKTEFIEDLLLRLESARQ